MVISPSSAKFEIRAREKSNKIITLKNFNMLLMSSLLIILFINCVLKWLSCKYIYYIYTARYFCLSDASYEKNSYVCGAGYSNTLSMMPQTSQKVLKQRNGGGERLQVPQSFQGIALECPAATSSLCLTYKTFKSCWTQKDRTL